MLVATEPCTRDTVRCPEATDYQAETPPCCRAHVVQIMRDLVPLLNGAGVTWWADYGTLLGAVRNPLLGYAPGMVPWDKDADLGGLWTDWQKVRPLRPVLMEMGYFVKLNAVSGQLKVRISEMNHTNIDLFMWRERPGGVLYRNGYAAVDAFKGREFPRSWLLPLGTVEWEGITLPAPAQTEKLLTHRYGDWMTPVHANNDGVKR